ncbi:MAG: hypothetical protein PHP06_09245 [Clostridia bacterium]|nr:hypothetical protein [Clostridia bacterium]
MIRILKNSNIGRGISGVLVSMGIVMMFFVPLLIIELLSKII